MMIRPAGDPIPVPCGAVTYTLRRPSAYERQILRGEASKLGARRHGPLAQLEQLRLALRALMEGEAALPELEELIDQQHRHILTLFAAHRSRLGAGQLVEAMAAVRRTERLLLSVSDAVRRADTPAARLYGAMVADDAQYAGLYGLAAARHLLDRVERTTGPEEERLVWASPRRGQPTPDAVLDRIDDRHFDAICNAVIADSEMTEDAAKNYVSPSPPGSAPASSAAASTQPPKTRSTRRTRGTSTRSAGDGSPSTPDTSSGPPRTRPSRRGRNGGAAPPSSPPSTA